MMLTVPLTVSGMFNWPVGAVKVAGEQLAPGWVQGFAPEMLVPPISPRLDGETWLMPGPDTLPVVTKVVSPAIDPGNVTLLAESVIMGAPGGEVLSPVSEKSPETLLEPKGGTVPVIVTVFACTDPLRVTRDAATTVNFRYMIQLPGQGALTKQTNKNTNCC